MAIIEIIIFIGNLFEMADAKLLLFFLLSYHNFSLDFNNCITFDKRFEILYAIDFHYLKHVKSTISENNEENKTDQSFTGIPCYFIE